MVIKLYQNRNRLEKLGDIIERMYGHHYSPATISNISKATQGYSSKLLFMSEA
ncbi:transposase [Streptococcus sp.]|uniref:transposase n=1 Tax=Streptococcus sp. TaxID=1306 RepID=UPI00391A7E7F